MPSALTLATPRAKPRGFIYCLRGHGFNVCKVGRSTGSIKDLIGRYKTAFGRFQFLVFPLSESDSVEVERVLLARLRVIDGLNVHSEVFYSAAPLFASLRTVMKEYSTFLLVGDSNKQGEVQYVLLSDIGNLERCLYNAASQRTAVNTTTLSTSQRRYSDFATTNVFRLPISADLPAPDIAPCSPQTPFEIPLRGKHTAEIHAADFPDPLDSQLVTMLAPQLQPAFHLPPPSSYLEIIDKGNITYRITNDDSGAKGHRSLTSTELSDRYVHVLCEPGDIEVMAAPSNGAPGRLIEMKIRDLEIMKYEMSVMYKEKGEPMEILYVQFEDAIFSTKELWKDDKPFILASMRKLLAGPFKKQGFRLLDLHMKMLPFPV